MTESVLWTLHSSKPNYPMVIPFDKDSKYVKRDGIIAQIDSIYEATGGHKRVGLYGLGGIG